MAIQAKAKKIIWGKNCIWVYYIAKLIIYVQFSELYTIIE
jgi:hypothetical protein